MSEERIAWIAPVECKREGAKFLAGNLLALRQPPASALGNAVADILGEVFHGLYHVPDTALWHKRTVWQSDRVISVVLQHELATIDGRELTHLVLLTHAFGLRLAIRGASNGYLKLQFTAGAGVMWIGRVRSVAELAADFATEHPPQSAVEDPSSRAPRTEGAA